jgi:hypothetical protein
MVDIEMTIDEKWHVKSFLTTLIFKKPCSLTIMSKKLNVIFPITLEATKIFCNQEPNFHSMSLIHNDDLIQKF